MSIDDSSGGEPRPATLSPKISPKIDHQIDQKSNKKKAYEQPGFRYEEVFVTSALSCGKAFDERNCKFSGTKVS